MKTSISAGICVIPARCRLERAINSFPQVPLIKPDENFNICRNLRNQRAIKEYPAGAANQTR